jgi:hypothetical protein
MTVRRMKTYTGGQGYVYQYYFVGKRIAPKQSSPVPATEYVFDVTSDRKTMFSVSVLLRDDAAGSWALVHGRSLTDAECYAAAKMRLFRAFDEIEDMMHQGRSLPVDGPTLEELLGSLGVQ